MEIRNLDVEYRVPGGIIKAVNRANLNVAEGGSLGLAGESGCGKSTLGSAIMRILAAEGRISGGSINFDGVDLLGLSEAKMREVRWRDISMIFQGAMNSFDPTMTIENQIAEAIFVHQSSVGRKTALERAWELLRLCEISPTLGKRYPHELSGGMKQRACIAMALILHPRMVIADEITTALDVMIQAQIFRLLRKMKEEFKLAMIVISHDLSVLAENCDHLAIMYVGHIVETGRCHDVLHSPKHPYVKGLQFCIPKFGSNREVIPAIKGSIPSLLSPPPGCPFNPRCPIAIPECQTVPPKLVPIDTDGHSVACHRHDYEGVVWK